MRAISCRFPRTAPDLHTLSPHLDGAGGGCKGVLVAAAPPFLCDTASAGACAVFFSSVSHAVTSAEAPFCFSPVDYSPLHLSGAVAPYLGHLHCADTLLVPLSLRRSLGGACVVLSFFSARFIHLLFFLPLSLVWCIGFARVQRRTYICACVRSYVGFATFAQLLLSSPVLICFFFSHPGALPVCLCLSVSAAASLSFLRGSSLCM